MEPAVLAETDSWLVLNKPPRWLTIAPSGAETLESEWPVLTSWASALPSQKDRKLWIVHRLDVETSGVVLFARTEAAHRQASLWFQRHEVQKTYHLLAQGAPPSLPTLKIQKPVRGQPATTQLESLERFTGAFLGRARPVTGRRHQIRLHLAGEGKPLLGDRSYGGFTSFATAQGPISVTRVALHSARLALPTGEAFESAWPEDFQGWVSLLRERAGASK